MTVYQTIVAMVGVITSLGIFAGGIGWLYFKFKQGGVEVDQENEDAKEKALGTNTKTLENLTAQVEALQKLSQDQEEAYKKDRKEQEDQMRILRGEVQSLKILIEERDRKISEYMKILQGKDPKLDQTLNTILGFIVKAEEYMRKDVIDTDHIKSVTDRLLGVPGNQTQPK